ncbi:MAG TPA: DUF6298 domain-containing protein [Acidobacteriaceae bacterium]|nr:DUF6298 domain-containing protein [Acidobacteriaceae bacterium]
MKVSVLRLTTLISTLALAPIGIAQPVASPTGIDYSYAGYRAGETALPNAPGAISVRPTGGDDTALLQSAIDQVSAMPVGSDGFRGAVVLRSGRFRVAGQLRISATGVVLRGSGVGQTTIVAEGIGRRTLIQIGAAADPELGQSVAVSGDVPTGARVLKVALSAAFHSGDHVVVRRPSTKEWISAIGMSGLPGTFANQRLDWQPGSHDLIWDRVVTRVDAAAGTIELDAPITTALEQKYGGGTVAQVENTEPDVKNVGVEDLSLESAFDASRPKDEEHAWMAIALDHVKDAWVQHVTARHFVSAAVRVGTRARRITVADCRSEAPVSEEGGYRRQSFLVYGQQVLVIHCFSESGMNDFASGLLAGGPNVFFDCEAKESLGASGSFEGWSSGVLYENVRVPDAPLQLLIDQERAQGAGWTAANSVVWNSTAKTVDVLGPPGGYNYRIESRDSLYTSELEARGLKILNPAVIPHDEAGVPDFHDVKVKQHAESPQHTFEIVNGHFVVDGKTVWGESQNEAWWRGDTSYLTAVRSTGSSITRFMPGQDGPGMTEVLPDFVERLKERSIAFYISTPGLWYEHRRDAHNDHRQPNGNVWAPFYEMPWARSGKGVAWDGLSLFDVSRYNPWYFQRHRAFIQLAAQQGIIVYVNLYNNHDVNEIGPHWIDFPWRPANNINDTGIPEPPPLRPNNRNDVNAQFFNVDYAPLRKLHHDYIFHTLDELGDLPNAIFTAAYQFAGPLSFEQFLQDTVAEWERLHGKTVKLALVTGKNTTDAILADPVRSKQISVVDMRYWEYQPDGALFAPDAGQNRAFRELISEHFPGYTDTPPPTTPEMMYHEVREYRDKYPNIALVPMENGVGPVPILMAGAASQSSLRGGITLPRAVPPNPTGTASRPPRNQAAPPSQLDRRGAQADAILDKFIADHLAADLMKMSPVDGLLEDGAHNWVLAGSTTDALLIDARAGQSFRLVKALSHQRYAGLWFDPATGAAKDAGVLDGASGTVVDKPDGNEWLLLLHAR